MSMPRCMNSSCFLLGKFSTTLHTLSPMSAFLWSCDHVTCVVVSLGYGLEVDMWAVGIITYIFLCGFPPFRSSDNNQTELFEYIKAGEYEFLAPYWDNVTAGMCIRPSLSMILCRFPRLWRVVTLRSSGLWK